MRIGITCYPTFGGSGVVATELGKQLVVRGHEIHFIATDIPFRLRSFNGKFLFHEVEAVNYPLFDFHQPYGLSLAAKMSEVITYNKLDILHVHYAIPHSISAFLARTISSRKIKVVTTLHGTDITVVGNDPAFIPLIQFGVNESDGVTAVSEFLKDETLQTFSLRKDITVIHNFVDVDQLSQPPDPGTREKFAPDGEKIVAHMSNFRPVKRVEKVVEIFCRIHKHVKSKLLLIGDGPDRGKAERMCHELDICDHTIFVGKQTEVGKFLAVSDLFICTSESESFGLSILEAMACGVPVISSRVGGIPEIIQNEQQGILIESMSVEKFAHAAVEILTNDELRRRMSKSGRERARLFFDAEKIVPQYESFYEQILSR